MRENQRKKDIEHGNCGYVEDMNTDSAGDHTEALLTYRDMKE